MSRYLVLPSAPPWVLNDLGEMAETGAKPKVPTLQRAALRAVRAFSTPLLPDDYLELINPLWSTRELRGKIEDVRHETDNAATVLIRPGYEWPGHEPGQYLRIGVDIEGVRHWRAYSLTSEPEREDGWISITVKAVDSGVVSKYLVRQGRPGCIVRSEEHTSELQSRLHLVCRLLLEKKKKKETKIRKMIRR